MVAELHIHDHKEELKYKFRSNWLSELQSFRYELLKRINLLHMCDKVIIDVSDSATKWGSWDPLTRVISLNSRLILGFPWNVTLGIFTHEIAHQIISNVYPLAAQTEPTHGPTFNKVCEKLGLHPIYRQASVDLTEAGPPPSIEGLRAGLEENPLLAKIKKLLALSDSPEPHEAEAALAKASELMTRHNIDAAIALTGADDFEIWTIPLYSKRIDRKAFQISCIIQNHFFAWTIFSTLYDPRQNMRFKSIELIGRPVNLSMAKHVYYYLDERCETLWLKHKPVAAKHGEKGLSAKTAFITNMLNCLDAKLKQAARDSQRTDAIFKPDSARPYARNLTPTEILSSDKDLDKFITTNYPDLQKVSRRCSHAFSPYSSEAGKAAGEQLEIHKPINQGSVIGLLGRG